MDFGLPSEAVAFTELQRYYYERHDPGSKEVRLIIKVELKNDGPVVLRFKNEEGVTAELLEKQGRFAVLLGENGIETPRQYQAGGRYVRAYSLHGYDVLVTAEEFVEGELRLVDAPTAEETGRLLAQTHNIAERAGFHIENEVLFDPFSENDLFCVLALMEHEQELKAADEALYKKIIGKYEEYRERLAPLEKELRYAVQGDISDCNLYRTGQGKIGIFDFNRSGDNILYCDAVMQALFEARLMDYPESCAGREEEVILPAFLRGYDQERPFSKEQMDWYPYLYALIHAFWSADVVWREDSLLKELEKGNTDGVCRWMEEIWRRLCVLPPFPLSEEISAV